MKAARNELYPARGIPRSRAAGRFISNTTLNLPNTMEIFGNGKR